MPARTTCAEPGCGTMVDRGRCEKHRRAKQKQYDEAKGSRIERGYDQEHVRERQRWVPIVARGGVQCWRCHELIEPGTPWHLGHADGQTHVEGPEHRACNLRAAQREMMTRRLT